MSPLFDARNLLLIGEELMSLWTIYFISVKLSVKLFECYYGPLDRCIDTWCYLMGDINCIVIFVFYYIIFLFYHICITSTSICILHNCALKSLSKPLNFLVMNLQSTTGVARIFDWGEPKPQITCNDAIRNFQKRDFLWGKDIVEWKI